MRKLFSIKNLTFGLCLLVSIQAFSQAKKPTIMVVPSDNWCVQNGYTRTFDNQGTMETLPDYHRALQNDNNLIHVISKLNTLMADRGFPLKNLESALKTLKSESAEDALLSSKSGGEVQESPIDKLRKVAKADIIMQLTYTIHQTGPKKSITFALQGLDAYTDKQVAGADGTGSPSFATELPVLLEEAVLSHLDNFNNTLQAHFDDMFENGREVVVRIKVWDTWDEDLETEFGDSELGDFIEDWMADNTVKGRYSSSDRTESYILFEQVRIPMYDDKGRAMDARRFCRGLQKYLKGEPFYIINKLMTRGLGHATLVLGDK